MAGTAPDICLNELKVIERNPVGKVRTVLIEAAVRHYLDAVGHDREMRATALHRLIAAYVGTRPWHQASEDITTYLADELRRWDIPRPHASAVEEDP